MPRPLNWIRGEGTTKIQRGMGLVTASDPIFVSSASQITNSTANNLDLQPDDLLDPSLWSQIMQELTPQVGPGNLGPTADQLVGSLETVSSGSSGIPSWLIVAAIGVGAFLLLKK